MGRDPASAKPPHTVLIALCGLSPAVITETVWALAHESPSILPDRVVVLTTGPGREAIRRDLLRARVWQRLRQSLDAPPSRLRFSDTGDSLRLFPASDTDGELEDILTAADNAAVGDFILETLRQFTENPDMHVVFSIAGGRKTMTALGALAMTLLGRPGDRLCHVIVNPPFDSPQLTPRYHFPEPGIAAYADKDGALCPATDARITLCDIPYVRTRTLFAEHFKIVPGTFSLLVDRANQSMASAVAQPRIAIDPHRKDCEINGTAVRLGFGEFLVFWCLCERRRSGEPAIDGFKALAAEVVGFARRPAYKDMQEMLWYAAGIRRLDQDAEHIRKLASSLKRKLELAAVPAPALPMRAKGRYGLAVPADHITIIGCT